MNLRAMNALLVRDLRLLWRRRGDAFQPVLFALLIVVLFALASDGKPEHQARIAAAVIWVSALLSGLLALDTLFRADAEDGALEQWVLSPTPLPMLVATRIGSHWLTTALPVIIAVPFLGELLHLPRESLRPLLISLLLGTPLLSLLGAVVAALTVGLRRAGILLSLLALPLYVPVLVFGAGSVSAAAQGFDPVGAWLWLAAGLVAGVVLAPWVAAAAIRLGIR